VTAVDGRLDIEIVNGARLGRGLALDATNTIQTEYIVTDPTAPACFGVQPQYVFDYSFTFQTNGTGSASVHWTYGFNTNCAVCSVQDTATMRRVGPP